MSDPVVDNVVSHLQGLQLADDQLPLTVKHVQRGRNGGVARVYSAKAELLLSVTEIEPVFTAVAIVNGEPVT